MLYERFDLLTKKLFEERLVCFPLYSTVAFFIAAFAEAENVSLSAQACLLYKLNVIPFEETISAFTEVLSEL